MVVEWRTEAGLLLSSLQFEYVPSSPFDILAKWPQKGKCSPELSALLCGGMKVWRPSLWGRLELPSIKRACCPLAPGGLHLWATCLSLWGHRVSRHLLSWLPLSSSKRLLRRPPFLDTFCSSGLSTFDVIWDTWELGMWHLFSDFSNAPPLLCSILDIPLLVQGRGGKLYVSLKYSYHAGIKLTSKCCGVLTKDLQLLQISKQQNCDNIIFNTVYLD